MQASKTPSFNEAVRTLSEYVRSYERAMELRGASDRYETLARLAPVGIYVTDANGEAVFVNDRWCEKMGMTREEALGKGWLRSIHPDDRERTLAGWKRAFEVGSEYRAECRRLRPDGRVLWTISAASALRDPDGKITGYLGTVTDVTELKDAQERLRAGLREQEEAARRERLLRRELDHRVGNNLAALLGLIRLCEERPGDRGEMAERLRTMVHAMASAHGIISRAHGEPVGLGPLVEEMVRSVAQAHPECEVRVDGPAVRVDEGRVSAMAMVLQELATNCAKHGALSRAGGRVRISWSAAGADRVRLEWNESGIGKYAPGPPGCGLGIVRALAEGNLGGEARFDFGDDGLTCLLTVRTGPDAGEPAPGVFNR